jgi:RimJ/RimL family protein N-acetyltransferase
MRLEPWAEGDLWLVERLMGDPAMTEHLGGPESHEKIVERQSRYELAGASGQGGMFKIVEDEQAVGSVGYWERSWNDQLVYETGWSVLPEFQGRGYAVRGAALVVAMARAEHRLRFMHAFPTPDNAASNGVCRSLGFTLVGECEFEFPPGHFSPSNDWQLDLFAES